MKRSEAVKLINEALISKGAITLEEISSRILLELELNGMKPPKTKVKFDLQKADGTMQKSVSYVNIWETE